MCHPWPACLVYSPHPAVATLSGRTSPVCKSLRAVKCFLRFAFRQRASAGSNKPRKRRLSLHDRQRHPVGLNLFVTCQPPFALLASHLAQPCSKNLPRAGSSPRVSDNDCRRESELLLGQFYQTSKETQATQGQNHQKGQDPGLVRPVARKVLLTTRNRSGEHRTGREEESEAG